MDNKNLPAIPKEIKVYIPTSALSKLSIDEIAAIEAGAGMMIKDYGTTSLATRVNQIVWDAFVIRGHNVKDEKYYDAAAQFATELQKSFSIFTIEHISEAVRMGAIGKLEAEDAENKVLHISAHGLCRWIWMWNDKVKREAISKRNKAIDEEEKAVNEEEKAKYEKVFKDDLIKTLSDYRLNRELEPDKEYYHAAMYEYLEKLRDENGQCKYKLNLEVKQKLWDECEPPKPKDHIPSTMIHDFKRGQELARKQQAKTAALKYVFDWLINNDKELELN